MLNVWRFVGALLLGIFLLILATGVARADSRRLTVADDVARGLASVIIQADPA